MSSSSRCYRWDWGVVFTTFPRPDYSHLERRDLLSRPAFTLDRLLSGAYTADVSRWFSDSEPFRDRFLALSMHIKAAESIAMGEEQIAFHATPVASAAAPAEADSVAASSVKQENAIVTSSGVIVLGKAPMARALMSFSGEEKGAASYARVINRYADVLGSDVQVYCMPIPTAIEFYCPEQARQLSVPERPVLDHLFSTLSPRVHPVDIYDALRQHVDEPIFLRTDHHWAPLGAYYAARCFADTAQVPVPDLTDFEAHTMPGYVGSMFGYSKDPTVKASPEDFVYYTPQVSYQTHYTVFEIDEDYQIVGEGVERDGPFFVAQPAGSSNAYSTFMGGDKRITQVRTEVETKRRLLVVKDSFGNALPGYLFGSFQEVHVVDFRYFPYAICDYISTHGITDLLFANNLAHACSGGATRHYREWLSL